jgi:hypothetical protein
MVWWPFAPKSERADTLEVTDLHSGAPPLYSTRFVVRKCFIAWCVHNEPVLQDFANGLVRVTIQKKILEDLWQQAKD